MNLPLRGRCARRLLTLVFSIAFASGPAVASSCKGTLYLTLDTGHMEPATAIANILKKHEVKATFFLANEPTKPREAGGRTLEDAQAPFWRRLVAEGHAFGSHTWDHHYFRADVGQDRVAYIPFGKTQGRTLNQTELCTELKKPEERFRAMTGRGFDTIWRAPGGKLTARAEAFAQQCGFRHIGWSAAGFLGDELSSETHSNAQLLRNALRDLKDGDILMMHLGIWSRRDPFWPTLDPLISGLKAKGFCFATLANAPPK